MGVTNGTFGLKDSQLNFRITYVAPFKGFYRGDTKGICFGLV